MKQQLESSEGKVAVTQTKLEETTKSLTEAQGELKTLKTKLAAARSAEAAQVKVSSSAIKSNTAPARLLANAEAAAQVAQLKEDLYADMTGLIITGIKREEDGDVYDCIQTGRNGSKLPDLGDILVPDTDSNLQLFTSSSPWDQMKSLRTSMMRSLYTCLSWMRAGTET